MIARLGFVQRKVSTTILQQFQWQIHRKYKHEVFLIVYMHQWCDRMAFCNSIGTAKNCFFGVDSYQDFHCFAKRIGLPSWPVGRIQITLMLGQVSKVEETHSLQHNIHPATAKICHVRSSAFQNAKKRRIGQVSTPLLGPPTRTHQEGLEQ